MSDQGPVAAETPTSTATLPEGAETPPGAEERTVLVTPKAQQLTNEELEGMIGELDREAQEGGDAPQVVVDLPGPTFVRDGWLALDEAGTPEGTVTKIPPNDGDTPSFPVRYDEVAEPKILVTPAGAVINDANMQPSPQIGKYNSPAYNRDYAALAAEIESTRASAQAVKLV